jgi:alkylation response protein AidB-like acyl-CoA dehydrogenase
MNFDFSDEQKLLQKTARDYLEQNAPLSVCRRVLESADESHAAELWKGAAEMGWLGAATPERYGGAGLGYLELALIAEELGRALAPIPFGSSVCLVGEALLLAGSDSQRERWLPGLVSGELIGALALAETAGTPGPHSLQTRLRDGRLYGGKRAVPDGAAANRALVVAQADAGPALALVDLTGSGVRRERARSLDPSRPGAHLQFEGAPAELLGAPGEGWRLFERLLERAAVLAAFEQLGGAQRALELTRDFALGRYAFGRPVASFQALKHRMVDVYVAIELARSHCFYAAWALSQQAPDLGEAACAARVAASDAFELAATEMIQMHGGVGYTWEYDCHLFYRRAKWLAAMLGSAPGWRDRLVEHLSASAAD